MSENYISEILRTIANGLRVPVMIILLALIAIAVLLLGSLIAEVFTERRHLKVKLPQMVDALRDEETDVGECIRTGGLLKRQKNALLEITRHPELTNLMREALAVRLLEEERARFDRIIKISDTVAKLGPMFGLLGTLIPLGPGIVALGQGDTFTLSQSLLIAFDTTIAGLISAAAAAVVSTIRKSWYGNYMSILEALMECVLEVVRNPEE